MVVRFGPQIWPDPDSSWPGSALVSFQLRAESSDVSVSLLCTPEMEVQRSPQASSVSTEMNQMQNK